MTTAPLPLPARLTPDACVRALAARDPRFDGLFVVGITSTRIYCRPICPARVSHTEHRRFFPSPASAEQAGFRPCLRCRPELAPGRAPVDAISRLGSAAAQRIEAGALNGSSVTALAAELGVSARHLRRALEREYGVSPSELAQTCRLLLAKRLLADTSLSVTRIAFASGFQSLRRFNAAFRAQYRMSPTALRRKRGRKDSLGDGLRLTLSYRPPLDWSGLLEMLERRALPGVEKINHGRYTRTVRLDGQAGVISVANADGHLIVEIASSLVPALMPLLPQLRRLFDLDAEPLMIDDHLARTGLAAQVLERPGVRLPGVLDPFEAVMSVLGRMGGSPQVLRRVVERLGEDFTSSDADVTHLAPDAARVAAVGTDPLVEAGMDVTAARALVNVARAMSSGGLRLDAGGDMDATCAQLQGAGVPEAAAQVIAVRTQCWPDAFPSNAGVSLEQAEAWRPWRGYAVALLELTPRLVGVKPGLYPYQSRPTAATARSQRLPQ
ncbi:MAG TPA: AlkA N-terminal domain-containing protein [Gemmatimonadales bacterium]|nr:AlkA N-terminal domain-containing protein [Gemmatimonadales bacterium]